VKWESAPKGAPAAAYHSNHPHRTAAERETRERVHSLAVVFDAIDRGQWPAEVEILNAAAELLEAASRWTLVRELEAVS
jgi:hypothetical protein